MDFADQQACLAQVIYLAACVFIFMFLLNFICATEVTEDTDHFPFS
jgi:hypothetical protein